MADHIHAELPAQVVRRSRRLSAPNAAPRLSAPNAAPAARERVAERRTSVASAQRSNAILAVGLIAALIAAGLGWGVAVAAWTSPRAPVAAAPPADHRSDMLAAELRTRDRELFAVSLDYRLVREQLAAERHGLTAPPAKAQAAIATADAAALRAARGRVAAQAVTVAALQQRVAQLQSDNAGFEQNYRDLLTALHRAQHQIFVDGRRLAAAQKCRAPRVAESVGEP